MAMAVDEVDEVCNMAMAVDEVCNMAMAVDGVTQWPLAPLPPYIVACIFIG